MAVLIKKTGGWLLHIVNSKHNYSFSESVSAHSVHFKKQLTEACVQEISHKIHIDLLSYQVFTQMYLDNLNLFFIIQNIYNAKAQIHHEHIDTKTLI